MVSDGGFLAASCRSGSTTAWNGMADSVPGIVEDASKTDNVDYVCPQATPEGSPSKQSEFTSLGDDMETDVCLTSVPSLLLRAVDIREALRGFGKHWSSIEVGSEDYSLSSSVEEISAFVSHDWATPRLQKTIALLLYMNGRAAVISSLCAATFSAAAVQPSGKAYADAVYEMECGKAFIPRVCGLVSMLVAAFTFVVVLCWWQRLRSLFTKPSTVFLDKLCINQTDSAKKAAGIMCLAGFLKASKKMVVLWTPRYFTRLWCTYELASWIKLQRDFSTTVHIVPVGLLHKLVVYISMPGHSDHVFLRCGGSVVDVPNCASWGSGHLGFDLLRRRLSYASMYFWRNCGNGTLAGAFLHPSGKVFLLLQWAHRSEVRRRNPVRSPARPADFGFLVFRRLQPCADRSNNYAEAGKRTLRHFRQTRDSSGRRRTLEAGFVLHLRCLRRSLLWPHLSRLWRRAAVLAPEWSVFDGVRSLCRLALGAFLGFRLSSLFDDDKTAHSCCKAESFACGEILEA
eukprot:TRINITY_DN7759_c0_g1_i1.p1 TRINITY_DN7759_c0_g1~~TRINITY_DN7759_c0_g1_i1.p1  ORF type:complete len:514 (+),score=13.63 TRINITY_DN7759_c0_g1_i1:86-1627(+)